MSTTATPSSTAPGTLVRCLLALLLGAQLGLVQVVNSGWLLIVPLAVLLGALVLSLLLDAPARQRLRAASARWRLLLVVAVALLPVLAVPLLGERELEVVVLALPTLTAFTLGGARMGMALGAGVLAWAGFGGLVLFVAYQAAISEQGGDTGALGFIFALLLVIPAFALAALGGMLGHLLRRWVLHS